jgi:competence protein ComEC
MGRKKKKINKQLKEFIILILIVLIFVVAQKSGIISNIEKEIETSGIANIVDTSDTSNVSLIPRVKDDTQIITSVSENINIEPSKLNILFFDVGQADCELIISNGQTLLIDAGNSRDGEKIVNAIRGLGISRLDYVVGTHVHEDHTGGMSYIVDSFDIGTFYLPYNTTSTTNFYKKLLTSLTNKKMTITEANIGDKFTVGETNCEIMSVDNSEPENINEESIVIEMSFGTQKYLFMGDAEKVNEDKRQWNDIDVLKVGHHGSNTSSSQKFLEQVLPEISIISVGKDNSYGLPKDKILERLNKIGSTIYRTDNDGTIQLISDGNTNKIVKVNLSLDGN